MRRLILWNLIYPILFLLSCTYETPPKWEDLDVSECWRYSGNNEAFVNANLCINNGVWTANNFPFFKNVYDENLSTYNGLAEISLSNEFDKIGRQRVSVLLVSEKINFPVYFGKDHFIYSPDPELMPLRFDRSRGQP
mgnify:CR=1 FL=1